MHHHFSAIAIFSWLSASISLAADVSVPANRAEPFGKPSQSASQSDMNSSGLRTNPAFLTSGEPALLETGFANPPPQARPLAWWHWINGNISKEGIRADLEDMKRVGLAGFQMLDVSGYLPLGPVRYGSEAWHEHVQYALRTAAELGLSADLMNCPGWSTSGGPWVSPELSMKKVVWTETDVVGSAVVRQQLPQPVTQLGFYRDIAIMAVPSDPADDGQRPVLTTSAAGLDVANLVDGNPETLVSWPANSPNPVFTFRFSEPVERRLLRLTYKPKTSIQCKGMIEVSADAGGFRKVREFEFSGGLGDEPALLIAFAPVRAKVFRVVLEAGPGKRPWPLSLGGVGLLNLVRTENFMSKMVEATLASVVPPAPPATVTNGAIQVRDILDLTAQTSAEGRLEWKVPAGRWTILRIGYTTTGVQNHPAQPEGTGLEVDKLDRKAVEFHFEKSLGRIIKEVGTPAAGGLKGLLIDSWEAGQQNWTKDFPQHFKSQRGYDLGSFLPALTGRVIESPAETEAFLNDFRRTVCDLIATNYFGTLRQCAHNHGLRLYAETYTGHSFSEVQAGANVDVNMAEFWAKDGSGEISRVKRAASMANTLGRNLVAAESFTGCGCDGGWQQTPANLKSTGDRAFASGLNQIVFHSYVHQPRTDLPPGFTLGGCGAHFGRLNTWWPLAKPWMDYLSRCQYLLQQGTRVADFLKLRSTDVDILLPAASPAHPGGYDFDYVGEAEVLGANGAAGQVVLACGKAYRGLILPKRWTADLKLLRQVERLVAAGVPVYGDAPVASASRTDLKDAENGWIAVVQTLWGEHGKVQTLDAVKDFETSFHVPPDFRPDSRKPTSAITWTHRKWSDGELYFINNAGDERIDLMANLRVAGFQPELWEAVAGRREPLPLFEVTNSITRIPLSLDAGESVFVVFCRPLPSRWIAALTTPEGKPSFVGRDVFFADQRAIFPNSGRIGLQFSDGKTQERVIENLPPPLPINSAWRVSFQPPNRTAFVREFKTLTSWSASSDPVVRYFSGIGSYQTTFDVPADRVRKDLRCLLNLGVVRDVAEVRINGWSVGGLWCAPFAVDLTPWLQAGNNTLEVSVANGWNNGLVGDEHLPADVEYSKRGGIAKLPDWYLDPAKVSQRQRFTFATWKHYGPDSPLADSGLLGPVRLEFARVVDFSTKASSTK